MINGCGSKCHLLVRLQFQPYCSHNKYKIFPEMKVFDLFWGDIKTSSISAFVREILMTMSSFCFHVIFHYKVVV